MSEHSKEESNRGEIQMKMYCQEVIVKFRSNMGGHNNQRITLGDGPTSTHRIAVTDTGTRLVIAFRNKSNQTVKVIVHPTDVIHEYLLDRCEISAQKVQKDDMA